MLRRWEPEKGGTRVERGVVGIRKRVRTGLRGRREDEERGGSERGKTRPTDGGYSLGSRISSVPTVEKRRRLPGGEKGHARSRQRPSRPLRISLCASTMFSGLPSRLSAPFGILGDEPKLAFRSQPGGIAKLASIRARNLDSIPFQS